VIAFPEARLGVTTPEAETAEPAQLVTTEFV